MCDSEAIKKAVINFKNQMLPQVLELEENLMGTRKWATLLYGLQ
jgi:hypothetical protein